jgi:hypothetical protein
MISLSAEILARSLASGSVVRWSSSYSIEARWSNESM